MSLVRRVAEGARCAVAADNFVPESAAGLFGTDHALNPAATRFAAITGAPLVTVWPRYERGVLRFDVGAPIAASTCLERPDEALRMARQFFENAVRRDLASWRRIVSFLERALPTCRPEPASGDSIAQRRV
jgi:lauroyl/myristoyl acyltransferase